MLHVHIITLGKLKETYWREAEAEYLKRLKPYAKIIIHELREETFDEKSNVEAIKRKEAEKIKEQLLKISAKGGPAYGGKDSFVIALDEHGKRFSSLDFAKQCSAKGGSAFGGNNVIFILGGPLGLDKSILDRASLTFSLSPLTFTHQMARVILLEQIYRSQMILNNRRYHY